MLPLRWPTWRRSLKQWGCGNWSACGWRPTLSTCACGCCPSWSLSLCMAAWLKYISRSAWHPYRFPQWQTVNGGRWGRITCVPCLLWVSRGFWLWSASRSMRCWSSQSLLRATSTARSGARQAIRSCWPLPCLRQARYPKVFLTRISV